jgi:ATP-dependent DNA helicase Rep
MINPDYLDFRINHNLHIRFKDLKFVSLSQLTFNAQQQTAITYLNGPMLVIAGAGSGKTRVITGKIVYLIRHCNMTAQGIVALTFTNKAAREMKTRLSQQLPPAMMRGLTVATFHTFGLQLLRQDHQEFGLRAGFSLFDAQDSERLVKEHAQTYNLQRMMSPAALLAKISTWKNQLLAPEHAFEQAQDPFEQQLATVYAAYEQSLRAYHAVDFDDLIVRPVWLLQTHDHKKQWWQNRVRYLLVDEYQDTNHAQYALVKLLTWPRGALTVVGDDDQSIYAWRGACSDNLAQLNIDYPQLSTITLEQNYRSSQQILKLANWVIAHNNHLFEKQLWSDLDYKVKPQLWTCHDEQHEAERVAQTISQHNKLHRRPFSDYAILYRGHHQARLFENALRSYRIPYTVSGGQTFFARTEIKDVLAYVRILASSDDDVALLRIINVPRRDIGAVTIEKLSTYAAERGCSLLTACTEVGLTQQLTASTRQRLQAFAQLVTHYQQRAMQAPMMAVEELLQQLDYETWLRESTSTRHQADRRIHHVKELLTWLNQLMANQPSLTSLADLSARVMLLDVLDRQDNQEDRDDCVHLSTLHAAKGLEFTAVFLVGMEENLLPHHSSVDEEQIQEERRLAYVGMTRARRMLTLTMARHRQIQGRKRSCRMSRFIEQAPNDLLIRDHNNASAQPIKSGTDHLATLHSLLSS